MTTEDAIRKIQYGLEMETSEMTKFGQLTLVNTSALKTVLAALHAQQEAEKNEPLTNADRIRAMSDEELARALTCASAVLFDCFNCEEGIEKCCSLKCDEQCLKWLQQPVKEDDHGQA